ncbi:MAG: ABC transporter permease [Chlorobi bacterium]|nr:ABC transporter permease [Chlorobiota bacterium]
MIWSLSWKNMWRSPVRSGVIIGAISIGMFAGVFASTFMKGWMNQRLESGVETEVSYIQIHHPKFRDNFDLKMLIVNGRQVSNEILKIKGVDGTSPRIVLQSMASSAETGAGVKIIGVDPEREKTTSNLYRYIKEGNYFESIRRNPVVIGQKLADKLKVRLKSKIIITLQDSEGNITGGVFRVCGIFDTGNNMFEEANLFVRNTDLQKLAVIADGAVHEITVHISEPGELEAIKKQIVEKYPGLEVLSWKEITPELGYINEIGNMYTYIFVIIILLALGFGIVNTMLMVVLERIKELGMLMAIGMSKKRIFLMLMLETIFLTLTGGIIGIILGVALTVATASSGIDLSMYAVGLEDMGYASIIFPVLEPGMVLVISILVILTGIVASIYPARKALKYNPADAIRIDM